VRITPVAAERQAGTPSRWLDPLRFRTSWAHGTHCLKLQLPAALRSHMLIAAAGTTLLIAAVVVGTALLCVKGLGVGSAQ